MTSLAYYQMHRETILIRQAAYRQAHQEAILVQVTAYRQAHREREKTRHAAYRQVHQEAILAQRAVYRKVNREIILIWNAARRALKAGSSGSYTSQEWQDLLDQTGRRCLACGSTEVTKDHVIPLSKGGSNRITNIQPLCGRCNDSKGIQSTDYRVIR